MCPLAIEVVNNNAISFDTDMLGLKYAQAFYGLDRNISNLLKRKGHPELAELDRIPLAKGEYRLLPTHGLLKAPHLFVVGTEPLHQLGYAGIRELGYNFLALLAQENLTVTHLTVTLHGVGYGLEVRGAFRAELLGMVDAYIKGEHSSQLQKITFAEINSGVADIMSKELAEMKATHPAVEAATTDIDASKQFSQAQQQTGQIFISYAREDQSIALQVADDLIGEQFSVWMDQINIRPGEPWDRVVQRALREAAVMILVLTKTSANSENVADEYHYFLHNKKTIIPILAIDFEMSDMPYRLSRLQHLDFREDYRSALGRLVDTLHYELSASF